MKKNKKESLATNKNTNTRPLNKKKALLYFGELLRLKKKALLEGVDSVIAHLVNIAPV
jgi:hypothetical protein